MTIFLEKILEPNSKVIKLRYSNGYEVGFTIKSGAKKHQTQFLMEKRASSILKVEIFKKYGFF